MTISQFKTNAPANKYFCVETKNALIPPIAKKGNMSAA